MKKIILLLTLFANISFAIAQENSAITFEQIKINAVSISQTENSFMSLFGNPDSTSNYENEIENELWTDYKYSGNSFYFYENNLVSFNLKNDSFNFFDSSIKVGLDLTGVSNLFQSSYENREIINALGFVIIDILMADGSKSDSFIVINYNPTNNIINSIKLGSK